MTVQVTNLINEPIVLTSIGSYTLKPFETKRFENLTALTSELSDLDLRRKIQAEVVSDDRHLTSDEVNLLRKSGLVSAHGNLTATYDGSGRLASLARAGGRRVIITYPSATQMLVTEQDVPNPAILTLTTDTAGRVTSTANNWS